MSPADKTKPVIPYIRQSRSSDRSDSPEVQWEEISRWAEEEGKQLSVGSFKAAQKAGLVERGVSGNKSWKARELAPAVTAVQAGEASGFIVYNASRLTREDLLPMAEVWTAVEEAKGVIYDVRRYRRGMTRRDWVAEWERNREMWEEARDRGAISRRRVIEAGIHIGPTPTGYRKVRDANGKPLALEPDPATAPAVKAAFTARADGASWTVVARILTEATGKRWSLVNASRLTHSRTYLGEVRSGEFVNTGSLCTPPRKYCHDPLVSEALFLRVQGKRRTRGKTNPRPPGLLSGIIVCAGCGHRMTQDFTTRRNGSPREPFYRCPNQDTCTARANINHQRIEPYVVARVWDELFEATEAQAGPEDRSPELEAAVEASLADLSEVRELRGRVRPAAYAEALSAAEEAVEEARRNLDEYTPVGALPPRSVLERIRETAARDNEEAVVQLRAFIAREIERVEVRQGHRGLAIEDKVTIVWRNPVDVREVLS